MATLKTVDSLAERLRFNPDSLVFSRVAEHYREAGDIKQAIDLCKKGLERHPDYVTGHIVLGRCYLELKRLENATTALLNVCRMDWRNSAAIKMLAEIFMLQGLSEKAGDLYALLVKIDPYDALLADLSSRNKGTGKNDLLEILGLTLSPTPAATDRERTVVLEELPAISKSAPLEDFRFSGVSGISLDATQIMADAGSAAEEMLTDRTTITGSDVSDRMSAIFGESPAARQAKTPPKPTPAPEETVVSFTVHPPAEGPKIFPRREDLATKETIKMPAIKEPPKTKSPLEIELEETMIIDADEAMLLRGDSGIRVKETAAPPDVLRPPVAAENKLGNQPFHDAKTQEILKETISQPADILAAEELIEKPQESLDEIISDIKKGPATAEAAVEEPAAEASAAVFEPAQEATAAIQTGTDAEDTISGDDVVDRLDGIFKEEKKHDKHPPQAAKEIIESKPAPETKAAAIAETIHAGMLEEDDVEKTATFLPPADDTISGDDVVERLEGIFKDKKKKKHTEVAQKSAEAPADETVPPPDKKEETDTYKTEIRDETVTAPADKAPAVRVPADTADGKEKEAESADEGPERTVIEMPVSMMPGTGADQTESFEETLIISTPEEIGLSKKEKPEATPDKDQPNREDTLSLSETISATKIDDIEIASQKTPPPGKPEAEDGKESTAVFEDFSPRIVPEAPSLPPDVPVFEPKAPAAALDIAADITKDDNPDDLPDQVLTPTLANIYLQQGQPQFALKIYQRLAEKDRDNAELRRQIEEVEKIIAKGPDNAVQPPKPKRSKPRKKTIKAATEQTAAAGEVIPPLAGVRLRKKIKPKQKENTEGQR